MGRGRRGARHRHRPAVQEDNPAPAGPAAAEAFGTMAQVRYAGETAFLSRSGQGWRVLAERPPTGYGTRVVRRIEPGPGQRSVWDFPRPPALEQWHEHVVVRLGGIVVAETADAWSVLETSHPPTYYLPPDAWLPGSLRPATGSSHCEWKGSARYLDVVGGQVVAERAAWSYPDPVARYAAIRDHVAVYPEAMDACSVDGVPVEPQPGGFYGGWVTPRVVGPFKGEPGTLHW